jgi:penicillin-binding protein 1A
VKTQNLRLQQVADVRWNGTSLAEGGRWGGSLLLRVGSDGEQAAQARMAGRGLRLAALPSLEGLVDGSPRGEPVDVSLDIAAAFTPTRRCLQVSMLRLATDRVVAEGHGRIESTPTASSLDVQFRLDHLDLRALFDVLGLDPPADKLGTLSAAVAVARRPDQQGPITVRQSLSFSPPHRTLAAIERLREPFTYRAEGSDGILHLIEVRPGAPGFIALSEVPPLFVRALLLAEDFGFEGHRGVDLSAVAEAAVASLAEGRPWRGASTITQQLVKNLLLSKERTLTRKLSELPLALLLDSRLDKERQLEIYLNVVEWGPGLYGLRPAAEHYFGKTPAQLSPKEMAFLVRLIPGPLVYQRCFASGEVSPAFEGLVVSLLGKLWSTGALTDEEYQEALETPLRIGGPAATEGELQADGSSTSRQAAVGGPVS